MHINWKKVIIITLDLVLGTYLVLAITRFNKPDEKGLVCTKVNINIQDEMTNGFLNAKEIKQRLEFKKLYPLTKPLSEVNTRKIEETLKSSPFVKSAECYKTQDGLVDIYLTQRMPIVRIKSIYNEDYYVDDHNQIMPNTSYTSDMIIATGYINKWYAKKYISLLSKSLMKSELWRNQIEQINVLPDRGIELVPRVGNHIIYIGNLPESNQASKREKDIDDFVNKKMDRLEKFYKYGLSQAGWNKYSYINIEFDNQIICKRHSDKQRPMPTPPVVTKPDSAAIKKAANAQPSNTNPQPQKATTQKAQPQKGEAKKVEDKKAEAKKAEQKKAENKKTEQKKANNAKAATKKTPSKKPVALQ